MNHIPCREGAPPPSDKHILVRVRGKDGTDKGLKWVLPKDLKEGPIRRAELDDLLPPLRWIWRHLKEHLTWCQTFEDWELGFMRDVHAAEEVAGWMKATYAYLEYTHRNPTADKAAVFKALGAMMNQRIDLVRPKNVGLQLEKLATNPPAELRGVESFTADGRLKTADKHLR